MHTNTSTDVLEGQATPSLDLIRPYEDALIKANPGISQMQARTMVYWALATYCDFDPKPLLLVLKPFGCGKSDLMNTLFPMASDGQRIDGESDAVVRDELHHCPGVAFFDERDDEKDSKLNLEGYLTKRFKKSNSFVKVNRPEGSGWEKEDLNINGWTVFARRKPFRSVALMSRCLIIEPQRVEEPDARVTDVGSLKPIADQLGNVTLAEAKGRAGQIWSPLASIADRFGDQEWVDFATKEYTSDVVEHDISRGYEPEEAVASALAICERTATRFFGQWIKISDVKVTANTEFEMNLKPDQVATILHRAGYEVRTGDKKIRGYPVVKVPVATIWRSIESIPEEGQD